MVYTSPVLLHFRIFTSLELLHSLGVGALPQYKSYNNDRDHRLLHIGILSLDSLLPRLLKMTKLVVQAHGSIHSGKGFFSG